MQIKLKIRQCDTCNDFFLKLNKENKTKGFWSFYWHDAFQMSIIFLLLTHIDTSGLNETKFGYEMKEMPQKN